MSALGRHRDSFLNLQSFRENSSKNLANGNNSDELAKTNTDVAVSYEDDEMFGLVIDEEEEFECPTQNYAEDAEAKSNDAMVSDEDDEMFGVFFFDEENDSEHLTQHDSVDKVMKSNDPIVSDDDDEMFGVIIDEEDDFTEPSTGSEDDYMCNEFVSTTLLHRTQAPKKGILKQIIIDAAKSPSGSEKPRRRRSIFNSRRNSGSSTSSYTRKNVRFSYDEDLVHEVTPLQPHRCDVWWDHDDYDNFKQTAEFLAHAVPNDDAISWINGNHESEPPASEPATPDINSDVNSICEKWWCKFGHSRRGLEHLCCDKEGSLRKTKVEELMKAVLNEQYKQALKRRRGKGYDHSAITRVSMKHTQWAKDLALAAGYADANAVVTEFDEEIKKNREDYMHIARTMSDNGKIMGKSLSSLALNKMKRISSKVMSTSKGA